MHSFHCGALRHALGLPAKLPKLLEGSFGPVKVLTDRSFYNHVYCPAMRKIRPHSTRFQVETVGPVEYDFGGQEFTFIVKPSQSPEGATWSNRSSAHRVFVVCPHCGAEVPAGRYGQHVGTKRCQNKKAA